MPQKEISAIDYKENWDRACIRMALGRRSNGLLLDFCKVENFDEPVNPTQQLPINRQVQGGFSTQKKKGCLMWATSLQQIGLSVQPGWVQG